MFHSLPQLDSQFLSTEQLLLQAMPSRPYQPKSDQSTWYSRGYLPRFNAPGATQFLTCRLIDAVPAHKIDEWKLELEITPNVQATDSRLIELQRRIAKYEDRGFGNCLLRDSVAAETVQNALRHFNDIRYRLYAWCVMPNHFHVLFEPLAGYDLESISHTWKSYTANQIQRKTYHRGAVWEREGFDRYIRDDAHFQNVLHYIEDNPVKAGLVMEAKDWKFSSARMRIHNDLAGTEAGAPSRATFEP